MGGGGGKHHTLYYCVYQIVYKIGVAPSVEVDKQAV